MPIVTEKGRDSALKRIYETGSLSAPFSDDVAGEVYALYRHSLDAYMPWFNAEDIDLKYYRGDQVRDKRSPKSKTVVNDNECFATVDAMRPKIVDGVPDHEILSVDGDEVDKAVALGQRVAYAKEVCDWDKQMSLVVLDYLVRGRAVMKCYANVSAYRIDGRRVMRDPDGMSFDGGLFVLDTGVFSKYEVVARFNKKRAATLQGMFDALETKAGEPSTPKLEPVIDKVTITSAPPGLSTPVLKYDLGRDLVMWTEAKKILVAECWIHDQTPEGNGLKYPVGRVVTVGIGAAADGQAVSSKTGTNVVVLDDRPNNFERLFNATRSSERGGRGQFPIFEILYEKTGHLSSAGVIRDIEPLQDALNVAWEQLIENMKRVNKTRDFFSAISGIKHGDVTNVPGEQIFLKPEASNEPIGNLVFTQHIPPFAAQSLGIIGALKEAIRNIPGLVDVFRGEKPGGVTAYSAIAELGERADNRVMMRAKELSDDLRSVTKAMALIAQDFDDGEMQLPDTSTSDAKEFVDYDPRDTYGTDVRVIAVPKVAVNERVAVIQAAIESEQALPGSGDMILSDPRYQSMLELLRDVREQQAQAAEQASRDEFAMEMTRQAMTETNKGQSNAATKTNSRHG